MQYTTMMRHPETYDVFRARVDTEMTGAREMTVSVSDDDDVLVFSFTMRPTTKKGAVDKAVRMRSRELNGIDRLCRAATI